MSGAKISSVTKLKQRAGTVLEETTHFLHDQKRWEAGLLYAHDNVCLPESCDTAFVRLIGTERRIKRNAEYANLYSEKIEECKNKGCISLMSGPRIQENRTYIFLILE